MKDYEGEEKTAIDYKNKKVRFYALLEGIANSEDWEKSWLNYYGIHKDEKLRKIIERFGVDNGETHNYEEQGISTYCDSGLRSAMLAHLQRIILNMYGKNEYKVEKKREKEIAMNPYTISNALNG